MPVDAPDVIDIVAEHAESQEVALVMVEARDWNSTPAALSQLDTKMALYAMCVLTGKFHQQYPRMIKFQVLIQLDHFSPMLRSVESLLRDWAGKLAGANIIVCSRRHYWNPLARLVQKLRGKSPGAVVRWSPAADSPSALLTPAQFTEEFAASLRSVLGKSPVEIVPPFEIKLTDEQGKISGGYTDNAYGLYLISPDQKSEIIQKFTSGFLETQTRNLEAIDPKRIVPVLKGKSWVDQVNQGLALRGEKKLLEHICEDYNDELIIAYAEDNPKSVRYLANSDLEKLQLQKSELRRLACANLKQILPAPEIKEQCGTFQVMAGGDYDASLLLLEDVWRDERIKVSGEIVVAVPSRDMLLVVGSQDSQGLKRLKLTAKTIFAKAPYGLTARLLVYRENSFVPFD